MSSRRTRSKDALPLARSIGSTAGDALSQDSYWSRSMRPLHVLVFLLPLLAAYEVGSIMFLTDHQTGMQQNIIARQIMRDFFSLLGVAGSVVPGLAMASVLLVWHIMRRDSWSVDGRTIGGMLVEALAWTLPLIVLSVTVQSVAATLTGSHAIASILTLAEQSGIGQSVGAKLTISIGAGLYEEMLFRLIGLALLHFILADLIELPPKWSAAGAVVLSALAFAVYHHPHHLGAWATFFFSGIYLGTVYSMRGFGIVVGTHALYDVLVLAVHPALT